MWNSHRQLSMEKRRELFLFRNGHGSRGFSWK